MSNPVKSYHRKFVIEIRGKSRAWEGEDSFAEKFLIPILQNLIATFNQHFTNAEVDFKEVDVEKGGE